MKVIISYKESRPLPPKSLLNDGLQRTSIAYGSIKSAPARCLSYYKMHFENRQKLRGGDTVGKK